MSDEKKKVLMVCLGNICRSPIAEAVFAECIKKAKLEDKWEVDSAAMGGWHVGKRPDERALKIMEKHGLSYDHTVRHLKNSDFIRFDFIFGMDEENISDLKERVPDSCKTKIMMLGDYDPQGERIIRDPYYDSGDDSFEKCYQQCMRSCEAFLKKETP